MKKVVKYLPHPIVGDEIRLSTLATNNYKDKTFVIVSQVNDVGVLFSDRLPRNAFAQSFGFRPVENPSACGEWIGGENCTTVKSVIEKALNGSWIKQVLMFDTFLEFTSWHQNFKTTV